MVHHIHIPLASPEPLQEKSANVNANSNPAGTHPPTEKGTKRAHPVDAEGSAPKPKSRKKKQDASPSKEPVTAAGLNGVHLDGEAKGRVPIFDTCDDTRKKITAHLAGPPKTSQAAFAMELSTLLPGTEGVSARQMGTFMRKHGPHEGASSPAFYTAYVFFEKQRVQDGKKKSKKREDMEKEWAGGKSGGFPRIECRRITMRKGETARFDKLGAVHKTAGRGSTSLVRNKVR